MKIAVRTALVLVLLFLFVIAGAIILYETVRRGNTSQSRFDTIIVLGTPAKADGTPSPVQRERVLEGVREFQRGVAPWIIMTGGAAHNRYVEAEVMAHFAVKQGVPASQVLEEGQARNTIQNAYYSVRIMRAHGWKSAEIVSSPSHLPRASLIFEHFPIRYRTRASRAGSLLFEYASYLREIEYTDRLRVFGFSSSKFLPAN